MTTPAEPMTAMARLAEELAPGLELIRPLGTGSAGRVWLAREPALRRLVAIKVLAEDRAPDDVARRRFEREARAAASVSHLNLTAVHRVGSLADGRPFIVMEYIEGRTLEDLLAARGPLPVPEALAVLEAVAGALAAAHRKGVVHRDVRPGNVMQEADTGRVVLLDFGIAALLETEVERVTRLTRTGERLGDPLHMSPEQLRGEQVTPASDIWGLGLLGYAVLGAPDPFEAPTMARRLAAILDGDPPPPPRGADSEPRLGELLRRCLDREPRRRPRATDVVQALERVRARAPETTRPDGLTGGPGVAQALPGPLRDFMGELRRRKVYRVAAAYAAVAFLVLEAADLLVPVLTERSADFWYRVTVAVTLAGFPLALALSWIFDITPGGRPDAAPPLRWRRRILPLVGLGVSVAAAVAVWLLLR